MTKHELKARAKKVAPYAAAVGGVVVGSAAVLGWRHFAAASTAVAAAAPVVAKIAPATAPMAEKLVLAANQAICKDGWITNAVGRQGAGSYHGGIDWERMAEISHLN
ncbi:MAG: hypothetical protein ACT4QG_13575 [Sporichthyaceae bacterium]